MHGDFDSKWLKSIIRPASPGFLSYQSISIRDTSTSRFAARTTEARIRDKKQRLSTRAIGATKYSRRHQLVEGFSFRLS